MQDKIKSIFPKENEIPVEFRIKPVITDKYLLDGKLVKFTGKFQEVYSPVMIYKNGDYRQKFIGKYPLMTEKHAITAMNAALKAYNKGKGLWPTMKVEERIKCVLNFVNELKNKKKEIVKLLMWEIGKNLTDSEKEFDRTIKYILDTVETLKELDRNSSKFIISQGIYAQVKRAPLGVVLCMGPYNYPLNETYTTLIPALIMGNTVIFKPPKFGVLLHTPTLEAFAKAFPPGVVNVIYGDGKTVITPIIKSGNIDVLAFIGSSKVADILKHQHPKPHRLKCVLGLDAKNPGIIMDDTDIDLAVSECLTGTLSFNGQRCTALKILFIHEKVKTKFIKKFTDAIDNIKIGMPWENNVKITPIPDISRIEYFKELIMDAKKYGAKIINKNGGKFFGTFFYPTVVMPVNKKMKLWREEQFGPVIPLKTFSKINEVIEFLINSNYGQQVSIFSKDPKKIANLTDIFVNQVSRVNLNSQCQRGPDILPFTGRKDSAEGTLSVSDALKVFSIRTLFAFGGSEQNKFIVKNILDHRYSKFISTDFIL